METGEGEKAHGSVHSTEKEELLLRRNINAILCYCWVLSPVYKRVKPFAAPAWHQHLPYGELRKPILSLDAVRASDAAPTSAPQAFAETCREDGLEAAGLGPFTQEEIAPKTGARHQTKSFNNMKTNGSWERSEQCQL